MKEGKAEMTKGHRFMMLGAVPLAVVGFWSSPAWAIPSLQLYFDPALPHNTDAFYTYRHDQHHTWL